MHKDYLTYQRFQERSEAEDLIALLKNNNIDFLLEDTSGSFDPSFANNAIHNEFRLKLKKNDFQKADMIQNESLSKLLAEVDKNYYLFEFSGQELYDVITKSDEWSRFDVLLARSILNERGLGMNDELLMTIRNQRIEELGKPEESQKVWILFAYMSCLLGGLLGVFIGWYLDTHKKTLPNGDQVYAYSENDRKHGRILIIFGFLSFVLWSLVQLVDTGLI